MESLFQTFLSNPKFLWPIAVNSVKIPCAGNLNLNMKGKDLTEKV